MPSIDRARFLAEFKNGVDLTNPKLKQALQGTGVRPEDLSKLDTDGDGVLKADEVASAFKFVDGFDRNGSGSSFNDAGVAGGVYRALAAGKKAPPTMGERIATAAKARAAADPQGYAVPNAPTSPLKGLSGNRQPGVSRPSWLANNNKCNQFVGDALTQAGVRAPTHKLKDGTLHYMAAEQWPHQKGFFDRLASEAELKPGDVVVVDYQGTGESTAHTEVVTGTGPLKTTGAHYNGAYEKDWSHLLAGATWNSAEKCFENDGTKIYLLRAKLNA